MGEGRRGARRRAARLWTRRRGTDRLVAPPPRRSKLARVGETLSGTLVVRSPPPPPSPPARTGRLRNLSRPRGFRESRGALRRIPPLKSRTPTFVSTPRCSRRSSCPLSFFRTSEERVFDEDEGTQILALDVLRRFTVFPTLEETLKKIRLEDPRRPDASRAGDVPPHELWESSATRGPSRSWSIF